MGAHSSGVFFGARTSPSAYLSPPPGDELLNPGARASSRSCGFALFLADWKPALPLKSQLVAHRSATGHNGPMKKLSDCRLYTFVDAAYLAGRDPAEIARQLCAGGSDIIQLRAKQSSPDEIRRMAAA